MAQNLQRTIKNRPVYLESRRIRTVLADDRGDGEPHVVAHRHVLVELVAGVVEHLVLGHELDELLVHLPVEPAEFLGPVRHLRNARRGVRRLSFPATTARPPALRSAASSADAAVAANTPNWRERRAEVALDDPPRNRPGQDASC